MKNVSFLVTKTRSTNVEKIDFSTV